MFYKPLNELEGEDGRVGESKVVGFAEDAKLFRLGEKREKARETGTGKTWQEAGIWQCLPGTVYCQGSFKISRPYVVCWPVWMLQQWVLESRGTRGH